METPKENPVEQADIAVGAAIASKSNHPLIKLLAELGKVGDQGPLYSMAGVLMAFGLTLGRNREIRAGVSMLGAVAAADFSKRAIKSVVRRSRPHVFLHEGRYVSEAGGSNRKPEQSFPSGHMAGTVAAGRALCGPYPNSAYASFAASGLIAAARVAKGAHWPLDVLAGAVVGWLAEKVSRLVLQHCGVLRR